MKVRSICLGCKVNTYESDYVLSCFKERGYEIVDGKADIYIINTCSVTNTSDAKSRKVINKAVRENPDACIVVMGCMIEANKDYINDGISIIIGNKDKKKVVELVEDYLDKKEKKKLLYSHFDDEFEDMFIKYMEGRTRAFVKIQDGCENFCSYCIIPFTRGKCRSKKKDVVIEEIKTLVRNGYKEIVLTGIHTGHYMDGNVTFSDLLEEIVKIKGLMRLRISSIEITELDNKFMNILSNNDVIVSHMHIPLQSGCDKILKLMNRKYDLKYFEEKIEEMRKIRSDISITTDIIVGFPQESEDDFNDTLSFANKIKFSKIHVFPYSIRNGTKAALMDNQIDEKTKKERVTKLINLSNKLEIEYLNNFINKEVDVLIEKNDNNESIGHTSNYLLVKIGEIIPRNNIVKVKILRRIDNYLIGEYIK